MISTKLHHTLANAGRLSANADILLRALENRAALVALEFEEARRRLTAAAAWMMAGAIALLLGGISATAVVAALFWDTPQRVLALSLLAGLEIVVAATCVWFLAKRWQRWQMFEHSCDQLAKDSTCLREILKPNVH